MINLEQFYENSGSNAQETLKRLGMSPEILKKFLKNFVSDPSFPGLEQALNVGDTKTAFRMAHTLKGLTANLGLTNIFEKSKEITELLRAGELEKAKSVFPKVKNEYTRLINLISELE